MGFSVRCGWVEPGGAGWSRAEAHGPFKNAEAHGPFKNAEIYFYFRFPSGMAVLVVVHRSYDRTEGQSIVLQISARCCFAAVWRLVTATSGVVLWRLEKLCSQVPLITVIDAHDYASGANGSCSSAGSDGSSITAEVKHSEAGPSNTVSVSDDEPAPADDDQQHLSPSLPVPEPVKRMAIKLNCITGLDSMELKKRLEKQNHKRPLVWKNNRRLSGKSGGAQPLANCQ
ncbi:unnamed protein product [Leuciscus chuanchicus]